METNPNIMPNSSAITALATTSTVGVLEARLLDEQDPRLSAVAAALDSGRAVMRPAGPPRPELLDEGGRRSYTVADIGLAAVPGIEDAYDLAGRIATNLLGLEVVPSPFPESRLVAKRFSDGDNQGWHLDTNCVSAVCCVSSSAPAALIWQDLEGAVRTWSPHAGDLAVFEGRGIRHAVPMHAAGQRTDLLLLNFYRPNQVWRPAGMDEFALGRK